jgi:hypothetical protein
MGASSDDMGVEAGDAGVTVPVDGAMESDSTAPPPSTDGGVIVNPENPGDDDGGQGCTCDVNQENSSPLAILLFGMLALFRPRRRR